IGSLRRFGDEFVRVGLYRIAGSARAAQRLDGAGQRLCVHLCARSQRDGAWSLRHEDGGGESKTQEVAHRTISPVRTDLNAASVYHGPSSPIHLTFVGFGQW